MGATRRAGRGPLLLAVVGLLAVTLFIAMVLVLGGDGRVGAPGATQSEPGATATPESALLGERLTVLILGIDHDAAREARGETPQTDTIVLASLNADQSELVLVSLPRDTVDIPLPDGEVWARKVNAIYDQRGATGLAAALEELYGISIDGHAAIDMEDFPALVDAVGGIEIQVEDLLVDPIVDLDLEAGRHELDGQTALAFVRTRHDDDFGRADRNQRALLALLERFAEREDEVDVPALLDGLDSFQTDLPLDELPALLELARRAAGAEVTREVIGPPRYITFEGDAGDGRGYVLVPDRVAIRELASELIPD